MRKDRDVWDTFVLREFSNAAEGLGVFFFNKPIEKLTIRDILDLKAAGQREGRNLEYKETLPSGKDDDRREFLRDVVSMANGGGGIIIYGVSELRDANNKQTGEIDEVVGIQLQPPETIETCINTLDSVLRANSDPCVPGLRIDSVESEKHPPVIIISIPRSFIGPHMVTFKGLNQFWSRGMSGKFPMDTEQVGSQFLGNSDMIERSYAWVAKRVSMLEKDKGVFPVGLTAWLSLHIVPLSSNARRLILDPIKALRSGASFLPIGSHSPSFRLNFEGYAAYRESDIGKGTVSTYVQVFRSGQIEAVATPLVFSTNTASEFYSFGFEESLLNVVKANLDGLRLGGIEPPVSVHLCFEGAQNRTFAISDSHPLFVFKGDRNRNIIEQRLEFPAIWIESWDQLEHVDRILKPLCDALWQACNWEESPNFDANGNWKPVKK